MTTQADGPHRASGARWTRLRWMVQRASRMSPGEVAHRVREQVRHAADRREPASWSRFGNFETVFRPLVDFQPTARAVPADLRAAIEGSAALVLTRRFDLLNQSWPQRSDDDLWLVDPVTGTTWPGADTAASRVRYRHETAKGDVKFVWEVNRLQMLPVLALAGPEAASEAEALLASWMRVNPPYRGINWTNGIEVASRLISLLVARSVTTTAGLSHADRAFVEAHVDHLERYPSLFSSANNHRVAELAGLFIAASCLPGLPRAGARAAMAHRELEAEVLRQFHEDGIGAEQSPTYAAYSLEWFALAAIVGDRTGAPYSDRFRARCAAAADALCWFADDRGALPALGDDDAGRVLSLAGSPEHRYGASVVNMVGRWLRRPDLQLPSDPALRDLVAADDAVDQASTGSRDGTRSFPHGGWTVIRENDRERSSTLAFDHAPLGFLSIAAHGHADALSVVLTIGSDPVFIDAGTYLYHGGAGERDALRGTPAHNTVAIAGADQSIIAGPFSWRRHARTTVVARAEAYVEAGHDGYVRRFGLRHVRRLTREAAGRYRIDDRLIRPSTEPAHAWTLGFTLHPDVAVTLDGNRATVRTPGGHTAIVTARQPWALRQVDMSPSFNVKRPTWRLHLEGELATGGDVPISTVVVEVSGIEDGDSERRCSAPSVAAPVVDRPARLP